ncbi:MAG: zf-HC2 domain-containing protein [Gemmatirosa sp.]|nr:zf-HC2 domain-containing protein [Gemmatirosa sp.]
MTPSHIDDGDLVRWLDGGTMTLTQRTAVERHLADCAPCAARHRTLADATARVHAAQQGVALPVSLATPPWHRPAAARRTLRPRFAAARWRVPNASAARTIAAATVLFVAGVAAALSPVRTWIASRATARTTARTTARATRVARPTGPAAALPNATAWHHVDLAFVPDADRLTIELRGASGDTLVIHAGSGAAVRVRARAPGADPTVIVLPHAVRLGRDDVPASAFDVELSVRTRAVEVSGARGPRVRLTRAAVSAPEGWRVVVP